jgi:PAS domain S-box-containing protein
LWQIEIKGEWFGHSEGSSFYHECRDPITIIFSGTIGMTSNREKVKILIVDDEVVIAADLESRLKKIGYTVCGKATTAQKALELVEQHRPDLVLMDIVIKGDMDGIDTAEIIREKWGLPVVFLTAHADTDRLERAKLTYPFGYLLKPFKDRDLKITLEMALYAATVNGERKRSEDSLRLMEKQLRTIGDSLPGGVLYRIVNMPDGHGYFDYVSTGFSDLFELSVEEASHDITPLYERLHPEDREAALAAQRQCAEGLLPFRHACRFLLPSGRIRWVRWHSSPERTPDNGLIWRGVALDITDHKRMEEALKISEEKYRLLFEHAPSGIYEVDFTTGKFSKVNALMCEQTGYTEAELLAMDTLDILTEESQRHFIERIGKINRGEHVPANPEFCIKNKDGSTRWVQLKAAFVNRDNVITGASVVVHDITERKQMEDALRESEKRFRTIYESAQVGIARVSLDDRILDVNKAYGRILGYSNQELIGCSIFDITHPENLDYNRDLRKRLSRGEIDEIQLELRYMHKSGRTVHCMLCLSLARDENGKPDYTFGNIMDITARIKAEEALRESESRFRSIYESAQVGIVQVTHDSYITGANEAYCRMLGYKEEELIGRCTQDLAHPDDREEILRFRDELIMGKTERVQFEKRYIHKDGHIVYAILNINLVRDKSGKPVCSLGSVLDITERKKAEKIIIESHEKTRSLFNAIGDPVFLHPLIMEGFAPFVDVNDTACRRYGFTREEFLSLTGSDLLPENVKPTYSSRTWREKIADLGHLIHETTHITKHGKAFPVEINVTVVEMNGVPMLLAVVRDITDRKQAEQALRESEERYRIIWENAIEGIAVVQQDGTMIYVNPQAGKEIGYVPGEMLGKSLCQFIYPQEKQDVIDRNKRRLAGENIQSFYPTRMITKDGYMKWINLGGVPINWYGHPATLVFMRDIHEQKIAEEILLRGQRELEQKVKQRTCELEMLNAELQKEVSKRKQRETDLRNLTREMTLMEERQKKKYATELHDNIGQYLVSLNMRIQCIGMNSDDTTLKNGLSELSELVKTIITFTRNLTFEICPPIIFDLGIGSAIELLTDHYDKSYLMNVIYNKRISDDIKLADDCSVFLYRSANELLLNAAKHSRADTVQVHLYEKEGFVVLVVRDDGIGFDWDTDDLEHGMVKKGYGLFGIRERTRDMHGELNVKSLIHGGTSVSIKLPLTHACH